MTKMTLNICLSLQPALQSELGQRAYLQEEINLLLRTGELRAEFKAH